ncbi:hypothetical protein QPK13_22335 [Photorhabdus tasmaniensis]
MAYTYNSPGAWTAGVVCATGDIFQVNAHDCQANQKLKIGDFYSAKFDGPIDGRYYPSHGNSNSNWNYSVAPSPSSPWMKTSSSIAIITSGGATPASIYANGLHMIPITICLTPQGTKNSSGQNPSLDPSKVSDDELRSAIQLINYDTGEIYTHLETPPSVDKPYAGPGWAYANKPNEFAPEAYKYNSNHVPTSITARNGKRQVTFWLVCNRPPTVPSTKVRLGCIITPTGNPGSGQLISVALDTPIPNATVTDHSSPTISTLSKTFSDDDIIVKVNSIADNIEGMTEYYAAPSSPPVYLGHTFNFDIMLYTVTLKDSHINKIIASQAYQCIHSYYRYQDNWSRPDETLRTTHGSLLLTTPPEGEKMKIDIIVPNNIGCDADTDSVTLETNMELLPPGVNFVISNISRSNTDSANNIGGQYMMKHCGVKLIDHEGNAAFIYPDVDYSKVEQATQCPKMRFTCNSQSTE